MSLNTTVSNVLLSMVSAGLRNEIPKITKSKSPIIHSIKCFSKEQTIEFTSCDIIKHVNVYSQHNTVRYSLPVNSKSISLDKTLLGIAPAQIGFLVTGIKDEVRINMDLK